MAFTVSLLNIVNFKDTQSEDDKSRVRTEQFFHFISKRSFILFSQKKATKKVFKNKFDSTLHKSGRMRQKEWLGLNYQDPGSGGNIFAIFSLFITMECVYKYREGWRRRVIYRHCSKYHCHTTCTVHYMWGTMMTQKSRQKCYGTYMNTPHSFVKLLGNIVSVTA